MSKNRLRTRLAAAVPILLTAVAFQALPAQAASPATTLNFTGQSTLQSYGITAGCDSCIPGDSGIGAKLTAAVDASWSPTASVNYHYSESNLRQGQVLDLTDKLTPGSGPLQLTWSLSGDVGVYNFTDSTQAEFPNAGSEVATVPVNLQTSETTTCPLKLDGDGSYLCSATHSFQIYDATVLGQGITVSVPLTTTLSITPDGITTVRSITIGGGAPVTQALTWHGPSPATISDPVTVPCTAVPGGNLVYDLTGTSTSPSFDATTRVNLKIDATVIITVNLVDTTILTVGPTAGAMTLTAPSTPVDFGAVLANNIPPTIVSPSSYTGTEGAPVQLDASGTTSVCPSELTYVWNLSDGGTEYGPTPQHAFADNGTWSGLLTVSDAQGNTSRQSFSVVVANAAPTATAGPDTGAFWGRDVAFAGSAVDPSSVDQGTLSYTWTFGDGTPAMTSGGASATHAYATPGTYTAGLVACDKDGACSAPSTRTVTVTKRGVTLAYLGDGGTAYDTSFAVKASLVDQFGQNVNAAPIAFAIGAESVGTVATNSAGIASGTALSTLAAGGYAAHATFAGSALYEATASDASFTIGTKATSVTYTGATTGAPNKVTVLSAVVKDASGKALAGVPVSFVLGSQSATATTDANGLASTSLKLSQKNGSYTLSATFAGVSGRYAASTTSVTFKLQAK